jgi:hypothetical protein
MIDLSQIERDIRRILSSHKSTVQRTATADQLFQRINGLHAALTDDRARSQFRADYRALAERLLASPPSPLTGNKARLAERFLDHARNLKEVEATQEKLNRELGDF